MVAERIYPGGYYASAGVSQKSNSGSQSLMSSKDVAQMAALRVRNKNGYSKEKYEKIQKDNGKLLKNLSDILMGKRLNVASHSVRNLPRKSLILHNKVHEQKQINMANQKMISNIMNIKTTIPSASEINAR